MLLAEDDCRVREERMLAGAGHAVLACGGDEALRLADAHRPGIAVLDVSLPEQSGLEQSATGRTPGLPVTARGPHGEVADGFSAGATGCVVRPSGAGDPPARVDTCLNERLVRQPSARS
ncbi:response regulator transcription factor [Dactylosporangium sp. CA-139114]|uniref:response regulator transcription factor n=1 Tax=Dactylosporangium sp. CA-139114 TaxID=3239931 RepID=UPI003D98BCE8